jgi:hypothetical protein
VEEVGEHLRPKVLAEHPKATSEITTRAILVKFNAPLLTGEDPTVDLSVGLRRLAWFEVTPAQLLDRHVTRDWGVLRAEDVKENELLLQGRLPAPVELPKYVPGRLTATRGRGCPRRSRYPVLRTTRPARVTRLRALEGERDPKRCAPVDPLQPDCSRLENRPR